jgi:hypothetical protein
MMPIQLTNLAMPAVALSGALLTFALHALPTIHFDFRREDTEFVFSVRFQGRLLTIILAALCLLVGGLLLGYGLADKWHCFAGLKLIC